MSPFTRGAGRRGKARGGSCHRSQRFKINNHKSQTFQMLQSQSQRMAQRILKSQVTDKLFCKFTDHRVFCIWPSQITDNTSVTSHRLIFSLFTNHRLLKSPITGHRNTSLSLCPPPPLHTHTHRRPPLSRL